MPKSSQWRQFPSAAPPRSVLPSELDLACCAPVEMLVRVGVGQVFDRDFGFTHGRHHPRPSICVSDLRHGTSLIYESRCRRKGGTRLKLAQKEASKQRSRTSLV